MLLYLASNAQSITIDSLTDEVTDFSEALWGNLVEHPKVYAMTSIYKWACGHSVDEMNDCIVRLYVEHGMIGRFMHVERPAPSSATTSPHSRHMPRSG